jgi:hypothetical protein
MNVKRDRRSSKYAHLLESDPIFRAWHAKVLRAAHERRLALLPAKGDAVRLHVSRPTRAGRTRVAERKASEGKSVHSVLKASEEKSPRRPQGKM